MGLAETPPNQRENKAMDTTCKTNDALEALESARKNLLARGATGISLFVHASTDTSTREYASEMVKYLALMTRADTHGEDGLKDHA